MLPLAISVSICKNKAMFVQIDFEIDMESENISVDPGVQFSRHHSLFCEDWLLPFVRR